MRLRELKARRTREALHDAVLTLAEEHGFDAVTIEQIAERAEVGVSTLYRYFPNKDAILLDPIAQNVGRLAEALRARPADEDRDVALGVALHEYLAVAAADRASTNRLRAQLDVAPGPRAQLWDVWNQQRTLLEVAIADRAGVDVREPWVGISAHITMMVAQLALDRYRDATDDATIIELADTVLDTLHSAPGVVPRLPDHL